MRFVFESRREREGGAWVSRAWEARRCLGETAASHQGVGEARLGEVKWVPEAERRSSQGIGQPCRSSQVRHAVEGFDVVIEEGNEAFEVTATGYMRGLPWG